MSDNRKRKPSHHLESAHKRERPTRSSFNYDKLPDIEKGVLKLAAEILRVPVTELSNVGQKAWRRDVSNICSSGSTSIFTSDSSDLMDTTFNADGFDGSLGGPARMDISDIVSPVPAVVSNNQLDGLSVPGPPAEHTARAHNAADIRSNRTLPTTREQSALRDHHAGTGALSGSHFDISYVPDMIASHDSDTHIPLSSWEDQIRVQTFAGGPHLDTQESLLKGYADQAAKFISPQTQSTDQNHSMWPMDLSSNNHTNPDLLHLTFSSTDSAYYSGHSNSHQNLCLPYEASSILNPLGVGGEELISPIHQIFGPAEPIAALNAVKDQHAVAAQAKNKFTCIYCKLQKGACGVDPTNPTGPCLNCQRNPVHRALCSRDQISSASLFAKGEHPQYRWSHRWSTMHVVEINRWAQNEVKVISITQDVCDIPYCLRVRQFIPEHGDALARCWSTDGVAKSHRCAPYAIQSMTNEGLKLIEYVGNQKVVEQFLSYYIKDKWLYKTYAMALQCSRDESSTDAERDLLCNALRLWVASRMESRSERICGEEVLGMLPQLADPKYNHGHILIPPVMSAQIELIMTAKLLQPLRDKVLKSLQKLFYKRRQKSWLPIYLTTFILLHSCAMLTRFEFEQARKYGLNTPYVHCNFVRELHNGAKIILTHFHCANLNSKPLLKGWTDADRELAGLTVQQAQFLRTSTSWIGKKEKLLKDIRARKDAGHDYFFVSQLFDSPWVWIPTYQDG